MLFARPDFAIYAGPDMLRGRRFCAWIGYGLRPDATPGEIKWRHFFEWSPRWPVKVRRSYSGDWLLEYGFGYGRRVRVLKHWK